MTHLIRIVAILVLAAIGLFAAAQVKNGADPYGGPVQQMAPARAVDIYACLKCDKASLKAGKCSCGQKMKSVSAMPLHGCAKCRQVSRHPGNCPKCKKKMIPMARTYACDKCKFTAMHPGNCEHCGKKLKEHLMPLAGK